MLQLYEKGNEAEWLRSFRFSVDVHVRYCELDGSAHVSNATYPTYFEYSKLQYLKAAGDADTPHSYPFYHLVADVHIRYVAPCFYDEQLAVHTKAVKLGRTSMVLEQALIGASPLVRATARVFIVCTDGGAGPVPWAPHQRAAVETLEGRAVPSE